MTSRDPEVGEKTVLTVAEVAAMLRISRSQGYELVARKALPALRLGRSIRIPKAALEQWMRTNTLPTR